VNPVIKRRGGIEGRKEEWRRGKGRDGRRGGVQLEFSIILGSDPVNIGSHNLTITSHEVM